MHAPTLRSPRRRLPSSAIAALAGLALSGCATLRGTQDTPTAFASPAKLISYDQALLNYGQPDDGKRAGMGREAYRDYIIDLYLIDIESRYLRFKAELTGMDRSSALTGDLALLALTGATALVGQSSIDDFATVTAVAAGARSAVDKRLFFDRTMPAVIAAMDTERAGIRADIATRRRLPPAQYTLGEAIADLVRLTDAGSIFDGADRITAEAIAGKDAAEARLKTIVEGCSEANAGSARLNADFRTMLYSNGVLQQPRVDEAARLLGLPANPQPTESAVKGAFDDKFCGDVGKRPFLELLDANIRRQGI